MKAAIHTKYGAPEVVSIQEIKRPEPQENEILVKVYASTVNRTDCGFRSAEYFISRFWSGLFKPKFQTLGCEFAGVVVEIGKKVTLFKMGDRVFGFNDISFGGHAEFLTIPESGGVTKMPTGWSYEEAAPIGEGAHYALCNIRASGIRKGQHALVYGSTGAIGSSAVQLLKYYGVYVTAVCNTKNTALVRSLGADEVIDYETQDFTKTEQHFEFIFDAVGKSSFGECKPLLTKKGVYISTELGKNGENIFLALWTPISKGKKLLFPLPETKKEDFEFLRDLAEQKKYRPVVDRTYALEDIVEAYQYVETGQKTGNVVIRIVDN